MKKNSIKNLFLNKRNIASLVNSKMIKGGTVSLADSGGVLYDIHTNPLDTNTNPLPTARDTNTIIGDTITEITQTAPTTTNPTTGPSGGPPITPNGNDNTGQGTALCV